MGSFHLTSVQRYSTHQTFSRTFALYSAYSRKRFVYLYPEVPDAQALWLIRRMTFNTLTVKKYVKFIASSACANAAALLSVIDLLNESFDFAKNFSVVNYSTLSNLPTVQLQTAIDCVTL